MTARRITKHINPNYVAKPLAQSVLPTDVADSLILEMDARYRSTAQSLMGKHATVVDKNVLAWQRQRAIREAGR